MSGVISKLGEGVLFDCFCRVRDHFYDRIDARVHAATYEGEHELLYAEPEFTGKFMDICARYYERERDLRALSKGMEVVRSIEKNIRADGYLGMLGIGNERKKFSVWNHAFTLYGLTRMLEATGEARVLSLVRRAADWIVNTFSGEGHPDILEASNKGCQNITCLFAMLRAYEVTKDRSYLDFVGEVIAYCETTDMNLLSFDSVLTLRSQKGIEMLVVYLGVLKYGALTGDRAAMNAAKRYFEELSLTQIRNTGNGTVSESWCENGNAARLMPTEEKPNETCVAVGIIELAAALFHVFPEAKYLDAIEKTLFNHMCGSLEKSGSDLAYYQGNYGRKIYRTAGGSYQCCRYRGFTLFSYLDDLLYYFDGSTFIPILYAPSEFCADGVRCQQITDYPASGRIAWQIKTDKTLCIKLRVPQWCKQYTLSVNGREKDVAVQNGYLVIELARGEYEILLSLEMNPVIQTHEINEKQYLSVTYGPLLMAHDTHFGGELWQSLSRSTQLTPADANGSAIAMLKSDEMTLVDFASAGGNDPENDLYTVFIPMLEEKRGK